MPLGKTVETLEGMGSFSSTSMTGVLGGNLVFNILLAGSLNFLWGMLRAQQILVHLPLFNITFPGNVAFFYSFLLNIAAFDALPTDELFDWMFAAEEKEPISASFGALGYETTYFIRNLGTPFVFFLGLLFLFLLVLISQVIQTARKKP